MRSTIAGMSARVVLQIAVGRHDEPSAGVVEAGGERRGLSEIPSGSG